MLNAVRLGLTALTSIPHTKQQAAIFSKQALITKQNKLLDWHKMADKENEWRVKTAKNVGWP